MARNSDPFEGRFSRFSARIPSDGDLMNNEGTRYDGRAHAKLTHKSTVSDRELNAAKGQPGSDKSSTN